MQQQKLLFLQVFATLLWFWQKLQTWLYEFKVVQQELQILWKLQKFGRTVTKHSLTQFQVWSPLNKNYKFCENCEITKLCKKGHKIDIDTQFQVPSPPQWELQKIVRTFTKYSLTQFQLLCLQISGEVQSNEMHFDQWQTNI